MSSSTVHNVISTLATLSCTAEQPGLKESPQDSFRPVDDLPSPGFLSQKDFQNPPSPASPTTTTSTSQPERSSSPRKQRRSPAIATGATSTKSSPPRSSPASHNPRCFGHPESNPPPYLAPEDDLKTVQDAFALTRDLPTSPSSSPTPPTSRSRQYGAREPIAGGSEEMGNKLSRMEAMSKIQVAKQKTLKADHTTDVSANPSSHFPVPRVISAKDESIKAGNHIARPLENGPSALQRISSGSNATSTSSATSNTAQTLALPNQHNDMGDMLVDVLNSAPTQTSHQHQVDIPQLTLTPSHTRSATRSSAHSPGTITSRKPVAANHTPQKSLASLVQGRPKSGFIIMETPTPELTVIHLHCYQFHRNIRESSNMHAPVPCMTCHREDKEMRWRCTWCCLRICGGCMETLGSIPDRDLKGMLAIRDKQRNKNRRGSKAAEKGHHVGRSI
jgi:hypothetical protein